MTYEILPSSPKALMEPPKKVGLAKYPWEALQVGQSFRVPHGEVKFNSLRTQASIVGRQQRKQFRVVDHGEAIGYEVALIRLIEEIKYDDSGIAPWDKNKIA